MDGFAAELRRAADPIWRAQHEHPFVRGVGDGTLPADRFARYVRQDYLFLVDYARLVARHELAATARPHRARAIRDEDVQDLRAADPVQDLHAEALAPALEDRRRQRLARRHT